MNLLDLYSVFNLNMPGQNFRNCGKKILQYIKQLNLHKSIIVNTTYTFRK